MQKWACNNKLSINLSKTKEIVFHRPNPRSIIVPSPLPNIEQVTSIKLLGVYISHDLATNAQTEYVLKICNQRLYLLNQLKKQGLSRYKLLQVFESIGLSRITYAVAAWWGFTSIAERIELQIFVHKVVRWEVAEIEVSLEDIIDRMELRLYKAGQGHSHSLFHLLPNKRVTTHPCVSEVIILIYLC